MRIPFKNRAEQVRFYSLTGIALAIAVIGLPLAASLMTQRAIVTLAEEKVADIAKDVLARSDRLTVQLDKAFAELESRRGTDPCSPDSIERMREMALGSADIVVVGFSFDDKLLCSSFGQHQGGLPIGPPDFSGIYNARRSVRLSLSSQATFFAVEHKGWTLFFAKTLPVDVPLRDNVSLATYSTGIHQIRNAIGFIQPEWMMAGRKGQKRTFVDDGYVVAVLESEKHASGAIAAIPLADVRQGQRTIEAIAELTSVLAGASMAGWILYFANQNLSISPSTLKRALKNDEFYLVYQPIVDLQTRKWIGAEALMRWRRGQDKEIPPDVFIAAAEKMGVVEKFTEKVLDLVARDAPEIFRRSDGFYLSLNLTADDLRSNDIVDHLQKLLARTHAAPSRFKVEITERSVLDAATAESAVAGIHALGIDTVIDDFGTGFSNLKYLTTFKFDYLKIDRAFVQGIGTRAVTGEVAFHIIAIARSLGVGIIAEGVEKEAQAQILGQKGVKSAQGWLFARPIPAERLIEGLQASPTN